MKPKQQPDEGQLKVKRVLELLNTEMKIKYPPGSFITFLAKYKIGKKKPVVSCLSYDKAYVKVSGKEPKNTIVSDPPEWQNISYKKAKKICGMFDDFLILEILFS